MERQKPLAVSVATRLSRITGKSLSELDMRLKILEGRQATPDQTISFLFEARPQEDKSKQTN